MKDFHKAILDSVQGDLSRRDYMRNMEAMLKKEGWWGKKEVIDKATGEVLTTRFDSRRLRLIYDVNTRQANANGRWERIQQARHSHPYLRYVTKNDEKVRHAHKEWHNLTLPVDDPFWNTHYPPNGWNCRCTVRALSQRDYDKGKDPFGEPLKTTAPEVKYREWKHKQTGRIEQVPVGIDPGWGYNVGKAGLNGQADLLENKLLSAVHSNIAPTLAAQTLNDVLGAGVFERWHHALETRVMDELAGPIYERMGKVEQIKLLRQRLDDGQEWPLAVLSKDLAGTLNVDAGIVKLSTYDAIKQVVSRTGQDFGPEDYKLVQSVLDSAKLVVELSDVRYAFLPSGRKVYMAVLHVTKDRKDVYLKSYRHGFAPAEVRSLRKRGRVLKDEWSEAREGDSP